MNKLVGFFWRLRRSIHRFFREALNHHISKAGQTNNGRKNGPISKNHNSLLKNLIINPPHASGQYQASGFSLVEVMIAAGLIGFFAILGMNMRDTMQRSQKILEGKFSSFQLMQDIETILSSGNSCYETFKEIDLKPFELEKEGFIQEIPIEGIKQVIQPEDKEDEPIIKDVFKKNEKLDYAGTRISKFSLKKDGLSFIEKGFSRVTLTFNPSFQFDVKDSPTHIKGARINFTVDPDNFQIQGCSISRTGSSGGGGLSIADPTKDKSLEGMTGDQACESLNMACSHIVSQNFAAVVYGQDSLANLCQINYNSNANEFEKGTLLSNIHSCAAKVGTFETYVLKQKTSGVTCKGIFSAVCK